MAPAFPEHLFSISSAIRPGGSTFYTPTSMAPSTSNGRRPGRKRRRQALTIESLPAYMIAMSHFNSLRIGACLKRPLRSTAHDSFYLRSLNAKARR
jgi:hypothetical protein